MSRLIVILIAIAAMFMAGSCVPSIHGIATESNLEFRPEMVGSWVSDDGEAGWVFDSYDEQQYILSLYTPDGLDGSFRAALVDLDGELFLDLFPDDTDEKWPINSFYGLHFIPVHTFLHVELGEGTLSLRMMDPSWLDAKLQQDPEFVSAVSENMTVLTASTGELQALLPQWLNEAPIVGGGFMGGDASPFTEAVVLTPGEVMEREDMEPAEFMDMEGLDEMDEVVDTTEEAPVTAP
ncbi:hypothetical protein KDL29_02190 [bacterium]|nr:hypothetical protein [bacterium]MCB1221239.1 hypothetical protein [bacterium]UNM08956.1 MAG: hypothetical protein H7A35_02635 [Planctomycetales bacterium]